MVGPADRDLAVSGQRGLALEQVDLVLLEEAGDAAGQALADLLAALLDSVGQSTETPSTLIPCAAAPFFASS